jgi:hypothetical protein
MMFPKMPRRPSPIRDSLLLRPIEQPRQQVSRTRFFVNFRAGNTPDCLEIVQYRDAGGRTLTNAAIRGNTGIGGSVHN